MIRGFFLLLLTVAASNGAIEPTLEKTPAYFYDLYGKPMSEKTVSSHGFVFTKVGVVRVKGQFSIRDYKSQHMRVTVIFALPELKAVSVCYTLNQEWTNEQARAAMSAYGGEWSTLKTEALRFFTAQDATKAILVFNMLHINSAGIEAEIAKAHAEHQAERNKVPKF